MHSHRGCKIIHSQRGIKTSSNSHRDCKIMHSHITKAFTTSFIQTLQRQNFETYIKIHQNRQLSSQNVYFMGIWPKSAWGKTVFLTIKLWSNRLTGSRQGAYFYEDIEFECMCVHVYCVCVCAECVSSF